MNRQKNLNTSAISILDMSDSSTIRPRDLHQGENGSDIEKEGNDGVLKAYQEGTKENLKSAMLERWLDQDVDDEPFSIFTIRCRSTVVVEIEDSLFDDWKEKSFPIISNKYSYM
jgi:hypothetical protein